MLSVVRRDASLDPDFDVYSCAMPFLTEASLRYPTGVQPIRSTEQVGTPRA